MGVDGVGLDEVRGWMVSGGGRGGQQTEFLSRQSSREQLCPESPTNTGFPSKHPLTDIYKNLSQQRSSFDKDTNTINDPSNYFRLQMQLHSKL